jgi:glycosyltransferase involved in cell wall biosynthesis
MRKLDLLMWTYNSASTLDECLSSIEKALPHDRICHKTIVDGGSRDTTENIARKHGWDFHVTWPGIPLQANFGLRLVDTDRYASFEHDVVLTPFWLERIERLMSPKDVAVAQGIRLSKGSRSLEALDRSSYSRWKWFYSLDNTMYKTDVIRRLNGYPVECPMSSDGLLRRVILNNGLKWITDTGCVSWHLRPSFWDYLRHIIGQIQKTNFLWEAKEVRHLTPKLVKIFLTSPVTGARIAGRSHTPSLLIDYPLLRYVLLVTMSVLAGEKEIITVPMPIDETLRA